VFDNGKPFLPSQGTLIERECSVQLTPLYLLVQISCFCYKKPYLLFNEEVSGTEPSPSVRVPWP
jgi:hypothetical protein